MSDDGEHEAHEQLERQEEMLKHSYLYLREVAASLPTPIGLPQIGYLTTPGRESVHRAGEVMALMRIPERQRENMRIATLMWVAAADMHDVQWVQWQPWRKQAMRSTLAECHKALDAITKWLSNQPREES